MVLRHVYDVYNSLVDTIFGTDYEIETEIILKWVSLMEFKVFSAVVATEKKTLPLVAKIASLVGELCVQNHLIASLYIWIYLLFSQEIH